MKNFLCRFYGAGCPGLLTGVITIILLGSALPASSQDETDIIKGRWIGIAHNQNSLYSHLSARAFRLLEERSESVASLSSAVEWTERQNYIRRTLTEITGPFPERTPLNARIVRTVNRKGFRIEHVIFESQPGFLVTSSLFIPAGLKGNRRTPAIIYCSGHSEEGYRSPVYMHVILNLVSKGFIVYAFDPVGQGERLEYPDPSTGKSAAGGPTHEHSYPGAQAFIAGSSQAMYMIWDGIRAVDYLLTRKEVDPSGIGITGRSGGGTQSALIAAFDDRIYAAAPENYITNFTRLLQSIGPQDAEQNLYNFISRHLDHPDLLAVRAPKPALMITTTGDMFSIQGAIETEREVARIYNALGKPENFGRCEDDAGHASTARNREAMYAFFQKHLDNPGNPADSAVDLPSPEELRITSTGQISTSAGSATVFSIVAEKAAADRRNLDSLRSTPGFNAKAVTAAERLSGYSPPEYAGVPVFTGRTGREGYMIEKYFIKGEGDYMIPYLLFRTDKMNHNYLIYLHPEGKKAEASPGGEIEKFVRQGFTVIAPDLAGTGETGPGPLKGDANFDGISHNVWYASILTGRSITGIRAGDVSRLVLLIHSMDNEAVISGFARKEMCEVMIHAAAFNKLIKKILLDQPCSSYYNLVSERFYNHRYIYSAVAGALEHYDLPDIAGSLAPRRLVIASPADGSGKLEYTDRIDQDMDIVRKEYAGKNASGKLTIVKGETISDLSVLLQVDNVR